MPRITRKMKMEELQNSQKKINQLVMLCLGYNVNKTNNIIDENGTRVVFGKENEKKFLKWGDGPFKRYKELEFNPVDNYRLTVQLFNKCIMDDIEENADVGVEYDIPSMSANIKYVRTVCLRDGDMLPDGMQEKFIELDTDSGRIESERYVCPTLAYIEIMFAQAGILEANELLLKRLDDLKHELEMEQ